MFSIAALAGHYARALAVPVLTAAAFCVAVGVGIGWILWG